MTIPQALSPELLARAADAAPGVLYLTDREHRIVWANAALTRATGFTVEEIVGSLPTVLLGGDRADMVVIRDIIARLDAGQHVAESMVLHRKDGSTFWAALEIAPLRNADGSVHCFLTNCIDISSTKSAERRLANILAGTRAGTWEWNVQTGETRFNERWAEIVGYTLAELEPVSITTWTSLAHPDDLPASGEQLQRHFSGESPYYEFLCRMRHRDGHVVWVHDRGQVTEWTDDGKPLWMSGTHIDVTDMMSTANALREARDRAQHVLDTVQSVIISLDREGRVLQLNSAGCTIVGVTEDEIRGRNWFLEFHPTEHLDELLSAYRQLMEAGLPEPSYTESEIITRRGDRRLVRWHHVVQRDETGRPVGLLSSGDDITELRQLERLATRRQRLESIGTLAGGIAHDLNNALSPVVMGMDLLRAVAPQEGPLLDLIETSTKRAAQMVRHLLTFARGAEGDRRALDVGIVVREVERLVRTTFPKNITLSVQLPDDTPIITGDATQLHQVLVNLAVNARDAMPNGGLLAITVQPVSLTTEEASRMSVVAARAGAFLRLSVRDTGEGIADGLLDRIFDPFYTTKGPDRGTGLGLSTVLGIVRGHDGFVQVDSRPGIGSNFQVYLPLPESPSALPAVDDHDDTSVASGGIVLFVDDEPFIRSMVTMLANRIGSAALTAGSTDEALHLLARSGARVSVVVTDLHMPGRDGLVLAREVRRRWPELPVVLVSGLMTDDLWRQVREIPNVSVLPKPFSEQQLRQALARTQRPVAATADVAGSSGT